MQMIKMNATPTLPVKPFINVGCLFDIPTGKFLPGLHGESILNGGLSPIEGIVGAGNFGKSTIAHYRNDVACHRMGKLSSITVYDTEVNIQEWKIANYVNKSTGEDGLEWLHEQRLLVTDKAVYSGDEWFDQFKEYMDSKKNSKEITITTPFRDRPDKDGKVDYMKYKMPTFALIDSISNFQTKDVTKMRDDASLGDKEGNTISMRQGGQRARLINETHYYSFASATYVTMVAHIKEKIQMDPYAPNFKVLPSVKNNIRIIAPPDFTFLTNNCWWVMASTPLITSDKTQQYPINSDDKDIKDLKDLNLVTLYQFRSKNGPSDIMISIILSLKEGVLASLSEFHNLKLNNDFGLSGNKQNYHLDIYPEKNLNRNIVRSELDNDPKLRRAVNITSELCQMYKLWNGEIPSHLCCDTKTLYEDIKKLGYDWDMLLEKTRGWWTLEDLPEEAKTEEHHLHFLSTMDLLKMRVGEYHPYWLAEDKVTILDNSSSGGSSKKKKGS